MISVRLIYLSVYVHLIRLSVFHRVAVCRHLCAQIGIEYQENLKATPPKEVDYLIAMAEEIVPYHMTHNAEAEACDLLMEVVYRVCDVCYCVV